MQKLIKGEGRPHVAPWKMHNTGMVCSLSEVCSNVLSKLFRSLSIDDHDRLLCWLVNWATYPCKVLVPTSICLILKQSHGTLILFFVSNFAANALVILPSHRPVSHQAGQVVVAWDATDATEQGKAYQGIFHIHGLPRIATDCHARHCKALINAAMGNFELTGLSAEDSRGPAAPHPSYPHQDLSRSHRCLWLNFWTNTLGSSWKIWK